MIASPKAKVVGAGLLLIPTLMLLAACATPTAPSPTAAPAKAAQPAAPTAAPAAAPTAAPAAAPTAAPAAAPTTSAPASAPATAAPAASGGEYSIGILESFTGPAASSFNAFKKAWDLQAEQANAAGGITVGGKKYTIKLVPYDDMFTVEGTVAAFNKLKADGIKIFIGPSVYAAAIAKARDEAKILEIDFYGGTDNMKPYGQYNYKLHVSGTLTMQAAVAYSVAKYPNAKRISMLGPNNPLAKNLEQVIRQQASGELKGKVELAPAALYYEPGTKDFTPFLTRVLAEKPDVINDLEAPTDERLLMIKQAREMGYAGLFQGTYSITKQEASSIMKPDQIKGIITGGDLNWDDPPAEAKPFRDAFVARWKETPNPAVSYLLDQLPQLLRAIQEANSFDPDAIVKTLDSWQSWKTTFGTYSFGGKETTGWKHIAQGPTVVMDIQAADKWSSFVSPPVSIP